MTRLVSGRILKTPSANVSAERYQFIEISEAEPDLGLPPANNYVFTSDPEGNRQWVDARTHLADENVAFGNVYAADTLFGNNLIVRNIDIVDAIIGVTTLANNIVTVSVLADSVTSNTWNNLYTANVIESPENLYYTDSRVIANLNVASIDVFNDVADLSNIDLGQGLIWDGNAFAPVYISSDLANIADLALRVASIENFTTANVREASSNLYFTNSRVLDALVEANVIVNDLFVSGDLVVQGNSAILNVSTLVVEDKNIILANGAINASVADGAGITIEGAQANIVYRESGDKIEINKNLDIAGNIIVGSAVGGSITGANIITTDTLAADLIQVDTVVSNNLLITDTITAETVFANIVANTIRTDSVTTPYIVSDDDLTLIAGGEVITFNTGGDLKVPYYIEFGANSFIGDEPGADIPEFRIIAAAGKGLSLETDADISGNNNVATFDISGEFAVPKSLQANSLVSNLLSITGIAQVNGFDVLTSELTDATFEPMGHEDKTESQISFDANTRQFTIEPVSVSYNIWVKGNKFVKTGAESVTLANVTDLYYIYFNTDGNLAVRSSYFDWENDALTSYIYFNSNTQSAVYFADERHGITLDWATHEYLHRTRGAVIAEGFSISYTAGGNDDANAQISLGNGTFFDEDLQVDVVHSNTPTPNTWEQDLQGPARIPMFYLVGTEWVRDDPTDFPLKQGTARIKYNLLSAGQWTTPDVPTDGYFTTTWIIATNNLNYPILAVMGQTASETIGQEEARTFQDLTLTDFPVIEFRPLYKIIWNTNTGYVNTPKAIISKVYDLRNIISASPSAAIASDHGLLSGLGDDDHAQYLHIETARTVTANHTFSGTQSFANAIVSGSLVGNLTGQVSDITNHSVNSLIDVDISGIIAGQIISWDGDKFVPGSADVALFSERSNSAVVANTVLSLEGLTTDDLAEGANLYFTQRRAIDSFTAGRNILILENGTISSTAYSDLYSLEIDGAVNYNVTDSLEPGITFPGNAENNRFGLRSLTVTNISDETAYIDANVLYNSTGNSATLANKIPVPVGGYLEFINKTQILQPNDKINLQAFDASLTPANNILSAIFTYETLVDDIAFIGTGTALTEANANVVVYESTQSYTILESIKVVNTADHIVKAKVFWADANSDLISYFVYNLPLPPNSSVEILQKPKRINFTDKILASYSPNSEVSVFVSGRSGTIYDLQSYTESYNVSSNSSIYLSFATTADEGTTLYYTVE